MNGLYQGVFWFTLSISICGSLGIPEEIHTTKVFILNIGPKFFDWSDNKGLHGGNQFSYRPSLLGAPDLPSWLYYTFSGRHDRGFVYGSPPPRQQDLQLEVIGLNRKSYEAKRRVVNMTVVEMTSVALYEVCLKLDRLGVEDLLVTDRYTQLLDVFRRTLWPESKDDLYVTFLASAVQLGARRPLDPTEGEGVVMHIGSRAPFSETLQDLRQELRPLQAKGLSNCPHFKHTSVERFFKQYNFSLDWCAFQLHDKREDKGRSDNKLAETDTAAGPEWKLVSRTMLPTRHYLSELALVLVTPTLCLGVVAALLTFILCCQQDQVDESGVVTGSLVVALGGPRRKDAGDSLVQYEAVQRASNTLRSLSVQRNNDESSPRLSMERTGLRPNPPPYSGVHHVTRDGFLEDDDAKTWYC